MIPQITEDELPELYAWVDSIPLSKPKKSITRDFSDGVCVADIVHYYFPKLVEVHNYSPTSNTKQKMYNWETLNAKVLKKLGMKLSKDTMRSVVFCEPGSIEGVLKILQQKLAQYQERMRMDPSSQTDQDGLLDDAKENISQYHRQCENRSPIPKEVKRNIEKVLDAEYDHGSDSASHRPHSGGSASSVMDDSLEVIVDGKQHAKTAAPVLEDLRHVIKLLELKCSKQEQLIRLKDAKIKALTQALENASLQSGLHAKRGAPLDASYIQHRP